MSFSKNTKIIHVDSTQIFCALYHLLDNAILNTPPEGTVCVAIEEDGDDGITLTIANPVSSEPVFSPQMMLEIFTTNRERHSGVGLGVVKRILRFHEFPFDFKYVNKELIFQIKMPVYRGD